jgi:hypothetical protein
VTTADTRMFETRDDGKAIAEIGQRAEILGEFVI